MMNEEDIEKEILCKDEDSQQMYYDKEYYERTKKAIGYSNSLIERLKNQRDNKVLCDMVLCAEDQQFHVHRYVTKMFY